MNLLKKKQRIAPNVEHLYIVFQVVIKCGVQIVIQGFVGPLEKLFKMIECTTHISFNGFNEIDIMALFNKKRYLVVNY